MAVLDERLDFRPREFGELSGEVGVESFASGICDGEVHGKLSRGT